MPVCEGVVCEGGASQDGRKPRYGTNGGVSLEIGLFYCFGAKVSERRSFSLAHGVSTFIRQDHHTERSTDMEWVVMCAPADGVCCAFPVPPQPVCRASLVETDRPCVRVCVCVFRVRCYRRAGAQESGGSGETGR